MSQTATQKLRLQAFSERPEINSRKPSKPCSRSQRRYDTSSVMASCATKKRAICLKVCRTVKSKGIESKSGEQNPSPGSHDVKKRQILKRCQKSRISRIAVTAYTEKCHMKSLSDEVLLEIFSYVKEKELCRLAQVCSRFATVCQDGSLWRSLYIRSFSLNKLLIKSNSGNYEEKEPQNDDGWKKCFQTLHCAHHVCTTESVANNYHSTINAAIAAVSSGGIIMVHGGVYEECLEIDKPVTIIGAAFGDREAVVIQSKSSPVITFGQGSTGAFLGHLTVKNIDAASSETSYQTRHGCIEVKEDCAPILFNCKLYSQSSAGATIYVHGKGSRPAVTKCTIADSENVGIFITDDAQGTFEGCEITNTKLAGVWVRNHASPIMRRNSIHHSRDVGLFIFDSGLGYYEANDVHSNRIAGFEIRSGANPTVVGCKIHHGMTGGIYCHDDARGEFLENQIYSNTYAGVWITSHSNPTIKNNEIYDGRQGGVYIFGEGRGLIEGNNIHDNALAGIQIRTKSNPIVRCNKIHSGLHGGLYVHESGLGLIEENEIFCNTLAGVWVTTESAPTLRHNRIHSGKQVGVYFYDGGCGTLEENEIFHHKYSGIQIRSGSNPVIRRNKIWGGQNGGVLVYNQGLGLLEENEIFDNAMAGVWIKTESNPVLRRNKIHDGREGGVCIFNKGKGVLEENDIFRNSATGVLISTASYPVLKGNRVFDGGAAGIEITNNAGGVLEGNEVFNNRFDGICLASDVQPKLIDNKVYGNKCEIERAVENEQCLFKVSRSSCLPLHDLYRCVTCRTAEEYAVCLSCVGRCHVGHEVEFLRRDRFVCDCGAGSSGVQCKLVGENCWSLSRAVRGRNGRPGYGENDTRVQELNSSQAH